jgi:predicted  nucleic acid-binding Zn-ribbon protein
MTPTSKETARPKPIAEQRDKIAQSLAEFLSEAHDLEREMRAAQARLDAVREQIGRLRGMAEVYAAWEAATGEPRK